MNVNFNFLHFEFLFYYENIKTNSFICYIGWRLEMKEYRFINMFYWCSLIQRDWYFVINHYQNVISVLFHKYIWYFKTMLIINI